MESDRSKYTVLPLTKFGLLQITRQRVRPELNIVTKETCPTCLGSGNISASITVSDQLEKELDYILGKQNDKGITIILHPYLFAFFTSGFLSTRFKWFLKYNRWVKMIKDSSLGLNQYYFLNKRKEKIEL